MADCLFCKIIEGEIPSSKVYEDSDMYAFRDIEPQAPVHVLIVPKKHIASLDDCTEEDIEMLGRIVAKVKDIAQIAGITNGYRLVSNCGEDGFQTVEHLHFHLLGGRPMLWPPG